MTNDALQGLIFIVVLFVVFAAERLPPVTIAVIAAAAMILFGWLTPDLITAAFANPAPITIASFSFSRARWCEQVP